MSSHLASIKEDIEEEQDLTSMQGKNMSLKSTYSKTQNTCSTSPIDDALLAMNNLPQGILLNSSGAGGKSKDVDYKQSCDAIWQEKESPIPKSPKSSKSPKSPLSDHTELKQERPGPRPLPNFHVILPHTETTNIRGRPRLLNHQSEFSLHGYGNEESQIDGLYTERPPWDSSFVSDYHKYFAGVEPFNEAAMVEFDGTNYNVCMSEKVCIPSKKHGKLVRVNGKSTKWPKWASKKETTHMIQWTPLEEPNFFCKISNKNSSTTSYFSRLLNKHNEVHGSLIGSKTSCWKTYDISLLNLINELEEDRVAYK